MDLSEVIVLCDQVRKKQGALKEDSVKREFHSHFSDLGSSHEIT